MARKKTGEAATPTEEKKQEDTKPEEGEVSAAGEAYKLILSKLGTGENIGKEALAEELERLHPGKLTAEKWLAGIGNARTKLLKEGKIQPLRRPRDGSRAHQPQEKTEPSLSDLLTVREWLSDKYSNMEEAFETVKEVAELASNVGGIPALLACLDALEKLSG